MSRISATTGLITGFPIASTVQSLIQLESGPVNALKTQNTTLQSRLIEITKIEAQLIALQGAARNLGQGSLYSQQSIASSNPAALTATINSSGNPPALGNYSFTPLQLAQSEQLQSSGIASDTSAIGAGTLSFRFGGFIDSPLSLALTNGGAGFSPGKIQVTDRSGAAATIDLTAAQNIGDVISTINANTTVHVQAKAVGNHLLLTDLTGASSSNLRVQEVAGGTTAASLGLATINSNTPSGAGSDIVSLFSGIPTNSLNDGLGVRFDTALPDAKITLADGTETVVTLHKNAVTGTFASGTTSAANGANAQLKFTAKLAGSAAAGVTVSFVDDPSVTKGNEKVVYNSQAKTLVFKIQQGRTAASDIINTLKNDPSASAAFSAQAAGGDATGLVTIADVALTTGPQSSATTPGNLDANAKITVTAKSGGPSFDNTQISFVDNGAITAGHETVQYDTSDPAQPKLIFQISAGNTTANDVIQALNNDPAASQFFSAVAATGSSGAGLVSVSDGATTTGGAVVEPVAQGSPTSLGDVINALNAAAPVSFRRKSRLMVRGLSSPI